MDKQKENTERAREIWESLEDGKGTCDEAGDIAKIAAALAAQNEDIKKERMEDYKVWNQKLQNLRKALEEQKRQMNYSSIDPVFALTMKRMIDKALEENT